MTLSCWTQNIEQRTLELLNSNFDESIENHNYNQLCKNGVVKYDYDYIQYNRALVYNDKIETTQFGSKFAPNTNRFTRYIN